jgi:hypothetical protein
MVALVVMLVVCSFAVGFVFAVLHPPRIKARRKPAIPKVPKAELWRIETHANAFRLTRRGGEILTDSVGSETPMSWVFDPRDDDSRADAYTQAENYCRGLNDAVQRAFEARV